MTRSIDTQMLPIVLMAGLTLLQVSAAADSGFYIGAAAGGATLESDLDGIAIPGLPSGLDEDDTATKFFGGYHFDLPMVDIDVEIAYNDFGEPDIDTTFGRLDLDNTGVSVFGIAALNVGPFDVYGKLGFLAWDVEAQFLDESASDDGTDIGYGLGLRFNLSDFQIRGEYELYNLDDADLAMVSLGVAYRFD